MTTQRLWLNVLSKATPVDTLLEVLGPATEYGSIGDLLPYRRNGAVFEHNMWSHMFGEFTASEGTAILDGHTDQITDLVDRIASIDHNCERILNLTVVEIDEPYVLELRPDWLERIALQRSVVLDLDLPYGLVREGTGEESEAARVWAGIGPRSALPEIPQADGCPSRDLYELIYAPAREAGGDSNGDIFAVYVRVSGELYSPFLEIDEARAAELIRLGFNYQIELAGDPL